MGRLVDEDDVKNWLQERIEGYKQLNCGGNNRSAELEVIKEELAIRVPTAYDPDKVVEQLEDYNMWRELLIYELTHREREIIKKAIEIVKGGGVDGKID